MGGKESKAPAAEKAPRRRTRSTAADLDKQKSAANQEQITKQQPDPLEVGSPSKKPKLADEAEEEVSKEVALARALQAMYDENVGEAEKNDEDGGGEVSTSAEVLVTIPNAKVHLMVEEKEDQNPLLASGDFSITRIVQRGSVVAVFAKIGDNQLQWPLAKDAPALKLSENQYVFSLRIPVSLEEDTEQEIQEAAAAAGAAEVLNYAVTFHEDATNHELLKVLDQVLESYSSFIPVPALKDQQEIVDAEVAARDSGKLLPKKSDYYWKQLAPEVDAYHSALARTIASSSGQLVKGILWVSEVIATQIERSGLFIQQNIKPKKKPAKISPKTMKNVQRAKKVTKMTENLASGMLSGVVTATGSITSSLLKSKPGAKIFGMLPGEAALATFDAFVRVFDALELAGKNVMSRTSLVTCQVVSHRFGDEAAALTKEGLSTAGHVVTTAWTISKIKTAINPTKVSKSPVFMKAVADELTGKKMF